MTFAAAMPSRPSPASRQPLVVAQEAEDDAGEARCAPERGEQHLRRLARLELAGRREVDDRDRRQVDRARRAGERERPAEAAPAIVARRRMRPPSSRRSRARRSRGRRRRREGRGRRLDQERVRPASATNAGRREAVEDTYAPRHERRTRPRAWPTRRRPTRLRARRRHEIGETGQRDEPHRVAVLRASRPRRTTRRARPQRSRGPPQRPRSASASGRGRRAARRTRACGSTRRR